MMNSGLVSHIRTPNLRGTEEPRFDVTHIYWLAVSTKGIILLNIFVVDG